MTTIKNNADKRSQHKALGSKVRVLDACCGSRMFWFDVKNPDVIYGDKRTETRTLCDGRSLIINPDVELDFRSLPFADMQFKVVVFDPPHLINAGSKSWMAHKYGKLTVDWRDDLRQGFAECFRVLDADGVLIFKWAEVQIKTAEILALAPYSPLFGHISGKQANTHWITFMKPNLFVSNLLKLNL